MTQRQQYVFPEHVPDPPVWITPEESEMIDRLALKAQATAIEFGVDLSWKAAYLRARHNLAFVKALAGSKEAS